MDRRRGRAELRTTFRRESSGFDLKKTISRPFHYNVYGGSEPVVEGCSDASSDLPSRSLMSANHDTLEIPGAYLYLWKLE